MSPASRDSLGSPESSAATKERLVVYLSGVTPKPVLADLSAKLAELPARLLHIFQSRLEDAVIVGVIVESESPSRIEAALRQFAAGHDLHFHAEAAGPNEGESARPFRLCVTLLGDLADARALGAVSQTLIERGLRVREVHSLGKDGLRGAEIIAAHEQELAPAAYRALRSELLGLGPSLGIDLAVQKDDFYRRSKRLLCMDVDSTFVKGEFIDELAEMVGVKAQVAEITARAMRGELDFVGSLRARVRLLKGLPMSRARELCDRFELSPGAAELVQTVRRLGIRVGLVSGGFDFFVEMLKDRFALDFAFANELEVENGLLTGEVLGSIVDASRKAQLLKDVAHVFGVRPEQAIAVGDGANDIQMLQAAGLGIAYQAKPRLREVADLRFDHHTRLDTLLYLMGFDVAEASRERTSIVP